MNSGSPETLDPVAFDIGHLHFCIGDKARCGSVELMTFSSNDHLVQIRIQNEMIHRYPWMREFSKTVIRINTEILHRKELPDRMNYGHVIAATLEKGVAHFRKGAWNALETVIHDKSKGRVMLESSDRIYLDDDE